MRSPLVALALAALLAAALAAGPAPRKSDARLMTLSEFLWGGKERPASSGGCMACVLLLGILNQNALLTHQTPQQVLDGFCHAFENKVSKDLCEAIYDVLDVLGLKTLDPTVPPEKLCQERLLCPSPLQCQLFQTWPPWSDQRVSLGVDMRKVQGPARPAAPQENDWTADLLDVIKLLTASPGLKGNIKNVFDDHVPMASDDTDGDRHATSFPFRGGSWRGRDCNDADATVYPGRNSNTHSASVDHNCNGIKGADSQGRSYEEQYCGNQTNMGLMIIGDSAAAHFSIPPFLLSPTGFFNTSNWDELHTIHLIMNEGDWPQCSWTTAIESPENCPPNYVNNGIPSIYQTLRQRNLCIHRDYHNIGVNGARTGNVMPPDGTIMSVQRDQQNDQPLLVFFALIGNDVCNGHPGMDHMTNVTAFHDNVLASLQFLDTKLPAGSHVIFLPLADGLLLREILANRTHPIGVSYDDIYQYLICEGKAPCLGWMTSNTTLRNLTQQLANNLSAVYETIVAQNKFEHFDMYAVPLGLLDNVVNEWIAAGNDPAELIEPVDGFHPSQTANALTVQYVWQWIEENAPQVIPPENPFNADIVRIFGNQGGY